MSWEPRRKWTRDDQSPEAGGASTPPMVEGVMMVVEVMRQHVRTGGRLSILLLNASRRGNVSKHSGSANKLHSNMFLVGKIWQKIQEDRSPCSLIIRPLPTMLSPDTPDEKKYHSEFHRARKQLTCILWQKRESSTDFAADVGGISETSLEAQWSVGESGIGSTRSDASEHRQKMAKADQSSSDEHTSLFPDAATIKLVQNLAKILCADYKSHEQLAEEFLWRSCDEFRGIFHERRDEFTKNKTGVKHQQPTLAMIRVISFVFSADLCLHFSGHIFSPAVAFLRCVFPGHHHPHLRPAKFVFQMDGIDLLPGKAAEKKSANLLQGVDSDSKVQYI
ncbi:unnamed protein product [Notodromas monacha]|uniref:Uncharacterized protein n=1 Tax=Notodromas monacha TaxID=399045 RepID=A0A7R9BII1_9CRUS|nr:unnamed protein product [Notodromas monacha]CAG0916131.1 unnamed protein product [Notodromas monacha]